MASFTLTFSCLAFSSSSPNSTNSPLFFSGAPSQFRLRKKPNQTRLRLSCRANPNNNGDSSNISDAAPSLSRNIDRRNVLLGIGGLYGVANLAGTPIASAADAAIQAPDVTKCHYPTDLPDNADVPDTCCPPVPAVTISDYQLPADGGMRTRVPAHLVSDEFIAKYEAALSAMRSLDPSHPHSFTQQANIHCAYCNAGYQQVDFPSEVIQVHNSWLFFPFHRWYLYFYEKILGKLINDSTFALPYWNWDNQSGMAMPNMFMTSTSSSLYDANRNANYFPPAIVDLNYAGSDRGLTDDELINENLVAMYRSMVTNGSTSDLFLGQKYVAGDKPNPGQGSIENIPHTPVHRWVGDSVNQPNGEDMGNFYSAGRDPLFYSHHANVDRMWVIWQQQLGGKNFTDDAWLDASFLFYDENENPVRVYVKDCLDTTKMGYEYQPSALPWLNSKPAASITTGVAAASNAPFVTDVFPVTLDKVVQAKVRRSKTSRTEEEKEQEEEVLVIDGIEVSADQYARFDVYLNDAAEAEGGKDKAQYAGGFAHLPQNQQSSTNTTTSLRLGLNEMLADLGVEDEDTILVTLAPTVGGGVVNVSSIAIDYSAK
ncbi:PREDICTED: polyphenol oxidase I, chloroplastic-like [Ipomoea nil]|uniref:polyphenol oxidase I, chloroplastic-like n=1 Tax=Ipomoea nil TaxID=35883 RepID=UPI00090157AE|nr:PREDICTED: polyphenol oxidase I, chloroplastic-like [Ipomoea nil]